MEEQNPFSILWVDRPKYDDIKDVFRMNLDKFKNTKVRHKDGILKVTNARYTTDKQMLFKLTDGRSSYHLLVIPGSSQQFVHAKSAQSFLSLLIAYGKIIPIPDVKNNITKEDLPDRAYHRMAEFFFTIKDSKKRSTTDIPIYREEDKLSTSATIETDEGDKLISIDGDSPEDVKAKFEKALIDLNDKFFINHITLQEKAKQKEKTLSLMVRDGKIPRALSDIYGAELSANDIDDPEALNQDINFILKTDKKEDDETEDEYKHRLDARIRSAINKHTSKKIKPISLNLRNRKKNLQNIIDKHEKLQKKNTPRQGGAWIDEKTGKIHSVAQNPDRRSDEPLMVGMSNPFYNMD